MSTEDARKDIRPEIACLFENFSQYFRLSIAQTPEEKLSVYRVRYNVYCRNFGFEDPQSHADGYETDDFDDQSLHCLVTHRATDIPAGCVRLVTVDGDDRLPLESHSAAALDPQALQNAEMHRERVAEISRLAVDTPFCRRRGDFTPNVVLLDRNRFDKREQRTFPLISVALFLAAGATADLLGRTDCFALMEPFLQIMLKRSGIPLHRAGAEIEYRGKRAPYYLDIEEAVSALPAQLRDFYDNVRAELAGTYPAGVVSPLQSNDAPAQDIS